MRFLLGIRTDDLRNGCGPELQRGCAVFAVIRMVVNSKHSFKFVVKELFHNVHTNSERIEVSRKGVSEYVWGKLREANVLAPPLDSSIDCMGINRAIFIGESGRKEEYGVSGVVVLSLQIFHLSSKLPKKVTDVVTCPL